MPILKNTKRKHSLPKLVVRPTNIGGFRVSVPSFSIMNEGGNYVHLEVPPGLLETLSKRQVTRHGCLIS
jgi:hypothetical protein